MKNLKTLLKEYADFPQTLEAIQYAIDVTTGTIIACKYVKKACNKFLLELRQQEDDAFAFVFVPDRVEGLINFAQALFIPDLNNFLVLLPYMKFIYAAIWGWSYKSDLKRRRIRTAFILMARKQSKTTSILIPFVLYDCITENSAESYLVSGSLDQANKTFEDIVAIIENTPELDAILEPHSNAISYKETYSRISFFASETHATDSYKNSLSCFDEMHEYKDDKIIAAFRKGSRARKNGLNVIITTAGLDINSPCFEEEKKAKAILDGTLHDDSYFGIIYEYDERDDWKDPELLIKSNPSLGVIVQKDVLLSDLQDALITPSHVPDYKSKTCSIWTNAISRWLPFEALNALSQHPDVPAADLPPVCYGGLDLSEVADFTVFSLCWKLPNNLYLLKHWFFIPEETLLEKYRTDNINIVGWVEAGLINTTKGKTIDKDFVFQTIADLILQYHPKELAYDRWHANELIKKLDESFPEVAFIEIDQNLKNFSPLTKEWEKAIIDGSIIDKNDVARWMYSNAVIKPTPQNDYKPIKSKDQTQRIDACITSIMAYNRACLNVNEKIYDEAAINSLIGLIG